MSEVTDIILATLEKAPEGLLSAEVVARSGLPSYVVGSRLSKLAAYGHIDKRPGTTKQNFRWATKRMAAHPA
jgi:hypothetical protein